MGGMVGYGGWDGSLSAFNLVRPHYAAQRAALQLPPRRAVKSVKKATISRAEGGQLQAPVSPPHVADLHQLRCFPAFRVSVIRT